MMTVVASASGRLTTSASSVVASASGRLTTSASSVVAIGIFDGVHRGHQKILRQAAARAKKISVSPIAVTFFPHPAAVLAPGREPPLLLSLAQRLKAFQACGVRHALVIPFTRPFSRLSPEDFVRKILLRRLKAEEVVVGHDFGFGHRRRGTIRSLKQFGKDFGFAVHVVPAVKVKGRRVSSRLIRREIRKGRLGTAALCLGRPPLVTGRVIRGSSRGKKIGFPTANLTIEAGVLPPVGVYAVGAKMDGRFFRGMANVGFRPTFQKEVRSQELGVGSLRTPVLEVHLFGVARPLYGKTLEVSFVKRLRAERRFASAAALFGRLTLDALRAKKILRAPFFSMPVDRAVSFKPASSR